MVRALRPFSFLLALLVAAAAVAAEPLRVYFFDVGQGDAALIVSPAGKTVLIDGGPPDAAARLRERVLELVPRPIDLVLLSHPHLDHLGGLDEVIRANGARIFLDPGFNHPTESYRRLLELVQQRGIQARSPAPDPANPTRPVRITLGGGAFLDIYWPRNPAEPFLTQTRSDPNANSIVARLVYGRTSVLFTGDAEPETEEHLLESSNAELRATVLKVGHHGGRHSSTASFLERVGAQAAVISVGRGNSYGHPTAATLSRLSLAGAAIYRTDLHGEVRLVSDGETVSISAEARPEPREFRGDAVASRAPLAAPASPNRGAAAVEASVTGPPPFGDPKAAEASVRGSGPDHEPQPGDASVRPSAPVRESKITDARATLPARSRGTSTVSAGVTASREDMGASVQAPPTDPAFFASRRSKVFHRAGCGAERLMRAHNIVRFRTREEAAAKHRPAKDCQP